ncbi:MAG: class I SAM-dependent rRNA methyltransferase [Pirellulaceae bacterium]|nr:class I SAM-dependent rRNA methyltransferase [Pirellulaceae bacterium]MCU0980642.1 class I SAM-dependent rRNA methyltransferase [Pirellulaceae bacterium]
MGHKRNQSRPRPGHEAAPQRGASPVLAQRAMAVDSSAQLPSVTVRTSTFHPLLYRKRIDRCDAARPGDLVSVYGPGDTLLGYGLYNSRSEIAVRMLFSGGGLPDEDGWRQKLSTAVSLRRDLLKLDETTDAYRVAHAEADGLSGLVVDRYGDVLSAEAFSLGMYQRAEAILAQLAPLCGTRHTLVRASPQFLSQEGYDPPPLSSAGLPEQVTIHEHGTRFRVRFAGGHKTGFFCDQRENRRRLAEFCGGRTVLDLCCYSGGFAVQAKTLGNAAEVTGVDLDEEPLQLARENANLNQVRVRFVQSDAFIYMREMLQQGRQYDVVVLDPPKLIRNRAELEEGTRKHFDLNRLAMRLVRPGGVLLSCCCSGLLQEADFLRLLCSASYQAGPMTEAATAERTARHASRPMQILARTGAAADHPVAAGVPESEYLKAVWMRLG